MQHNDAPANNYYISGKAAHDEGNYAEAIAHYSKAIELNRKNEDIYLQRAHCYYQTKEYMKAIDDLNKTLKLNPKNAEAWRLGGSTYRQLNQFQKAESLLNKSLLLNPSDHVTHNQLGIVFALTQQYMKSKIAYTNALDLSSSAINYFNRAVANSRMHYYSSAILDYKAGLKLNPDSPEAYTGMSFAYAQRALNHQSLGRLGLAIKDYCKSIELNDDEKTTKKLALLLAKNSKKAIFASIQQLPEKNAIALLKQVLNKNTALGKRFHHVDFVFFQQSTKPPIMQEVRNYLKFLTAEETQLKMAALLISQGQRDPESAFSNIPTEIGLQIAAAVNETLEPNKVKQLLDDNFCIPRMKRS